MDFDNSSKENDMQDFKLKFEFRKKSFFKT